MKTNKKLSRHQRDDFQMRVAFIAHALMPDYLSTKLIKERLKELGQTWPNPGEDPGFIKWFSFPVIPYTGTGLRSVWADFYIIPVLAADFLKAIRAGVAYGWAESVALSTIEEAGQDKASLTIGWGALTKLATNHGLTFMVEHEEFSSLVSSTHGDAGTAALVIASLQKAGIKPGFRVAIIGANGAIGDVLSHAVVALKPQSMVLVGKKDKPGENKNFSRLDNLCRRVTATVQNGQKIEVVIHQDKMTACHDHKSNVVIVATTGMDLLPGEIPAGTLVLDMTTPAACKANQEWSGRMILTSGCGEFDTGVIPDSFGRIGSRSLRDIGAGGRQVIWGCTGEAIARAAAGWNGHLVGPKIPIEDVRWCENFFKLLGFFPQPPISFGKLLTWEGVRQFVRSFQK